MQDNPITYDEYKILSKLFLISKNGIVDSATLETLSTYIEMDKMKLRQYLNILQDKNLLSMKKIGRKYIYQIDTNMFKKH